MAPQKYASMIADAEHKLLGLEAKLAEIEKMKKMESSVRKDIAALQAQISEWQSEQAFFQQEKPAFEEEDEEAENDQKNAEDTSALKASPDDPQVEKQKRLRALNKKLQQIQRLKEKGGELDADAAAKVASEAGILNEIALLKDGKEPAPEIVEEKNPEHKEALTLELPSDPADREKRLKLLKKKLAQIESLREKSNLDADEAAKVASQLRLAKEAAALENGDSEVFFPGGDEEQAEEWAAEKFEVEKKLKALRKKLDQIERLKAKTESLDADAQAKVASEPTLKKEVHSLEAKMGTLNKLERERVARRLGWENDVHSGKAASKSKAKSKAKAAP